MIPHIGRSCRGRNLSGIGQVFRSFCTQAQSHGYCVAATCRHRSSWEAALFRTHRTSGHEGSSSDRTRAAETLPSIALNASLQTQGVHIHAYLHTNTWSRLMANNPSFCNRGRRERHCLSSGVAKHLDHTARMTSPPCRLHIWPLGRIASTTKQLLQRNKRFSFPSRTLSMISNTPGSVGSCASRPCRIWRMHPAEAARYKSCIPARHQQERTKRIVGDIGSPSVRSTCLTSAAWSNCCT